MNENKSVFEQLEVLQLELQKLKSKQRTLTDQLDENDPIVSEFIKTANRKWIYNGDKSDLTRKNNRNKIKYIFRFILLSLYFAVSCLFIAKPYGWIITLFGCLICICEIIMHIRMIKSNKYELDYNAIVNKWEFSETDDNGIISCVKNKWWFSFLNVLIIFLPFILDICFNLWKFWSQYSIAGILIAIPLSMINTFLFRNTQFRYSLHFIDEKNDVEYANLKEFMQRNNLK